MQTTQNTTHAERNPDVTRRRILDATFREIYRNGFQGMRLDEVLAVTGLTKGALYHHFPNKRALGYAVVDEIIGPMMDGIWLQPLKNAADPLQAMMSVIEQLPDNKPSELLQYGCPLNNLAQEMSPLDEGFRQRLGAVYSQWHAVTEQALQRARQQGRIRADVDCGETATFVLAALEGCIGMAKNSQSRQALTVCNRGLINYLRLLQTDKPRS
jgi:TetR/AcrR family transcriptional regulator, transcriptional repressor for nem operon